MPELREMQQKQRIVNCIKEIWHRTENRDNRYIRLRQADSGQIGQNLYSQTALETGEFWLFGMHGRSSRGRRTVSN